MDQRQNLKQWEERIVWGGLGGMVAYCTRVELLCVDLWGRGGLLFNLDSVEVSV